MTSNIFSVEFLATITFPVFASAILIYIAFGNFLANKKN
jgi:hypothetical protein